MRGTIRRSIIAAASAVTLVVLAAPAQAAYTVRANWAMNSLPTMIDSAGKDNNGTTYGLTLVTVASKNKAYQFDPSADYATAPDADNLDPAAADIRVSARIDVTQPLADGETYDVIRKGTSTTAGGYYKIEVKKTTAGSIASCRFRDANGILGQANGTLDLAGRGWVTVVCTRTATQVKLTAAGQTVTVSKTVGAISNAAGVVIGGKGDGTDALPGLMDFAKIEIG